MKNFPEFPFTDYFMNFILSVTAGFAVIIVGILFWNRYISNGSAQYLIYPVSLAAFLYFAYLLISGKYKNPLSTAVKLLLSFPPVMLIILAFAGIIPINMQLCYTQCQSNMKNLGTALEMYSVDNHGKYPKRLEQLTPDYIREIPRCTYTLKKDSPAAKYYGRMWGFYSGDYVYSSSVNPDRYTFYCPGNNHRDWGCGRNYPQYNSERGLIAK